MEADAQSCPDFLGLCDELEVIRSGHVREAWSEIVEIRPDQRVRKLVDVVLYDHQVSHVVVEVDSSCCIGDEQVFDSDHLHHSDREGHKFHRIAFIVMYAALHRDDGFPAQFTDDEIALVAYRCRHWKSGDCPVWDCDRIADAFGEFAKTASEDDSDLRSEVSELTLDVVGCCIDSFCSWVHIRFLLNGI